MNLTSQIKTLAREIGFDEVGITTPGALIEGEQAIQNWVDEGRHGSMKYMEDYHLRRERFLREFGTVKSIIVLGTNYYTNGIASSRVGGIRNDVPKGTAKTAVIASGAKQSPLRGRVARYAWGKDYHYVIRKKHDQLITRMKSIAGDFKAQSCVDTQPFPERFAATKAGFGFIGKHTNLLSKKFGPWLFLSEIVTDLDLDESVSDSGDCPKGTALILMKKNDEGGCGPCDYCQKVCPTGALDRDYQIDARRCIAYLTIEHKGDIPEEIRPHIKDWVFGCDECLNVCPFTSKSKDSRWQELRPESGSGEWLEIEKLFEIKSNSEYERKFRGTAMMRINRKQMLRNACVVLGNSKDLRAVPLLERASHDSSPLVREHASWALNRLAVQKTLKYSPDQNL